LPVLYYVNSLLVKFIAYSFFYQCMVNKDEYITTRLKLVWSIPIDSCKSNEQSCIVQP